ncbi:MAG: hypothetical protein INH41_14640 [Myxococcaceae bacterium]|jgi:hypothetical protein|nr:hypothetical protein [Myxococcaceae bacterium]MCA3013616.1 hypothetical protein [Myxococcaceae bacterium]
MSLWTVRVLSRKFSFRADAVGSATGAAANANVARGLAEQVRAPALGDVPDVLRELVSHMLAAAPGARAPIPPLVAALRAHAADEFTVADRARTRLASVRTAQDTDPPPEPP